MAHTIMIMAGGTGGHIYPGLAVAEVLREQGWRIVWLGAREGMEARIVPSHAIEMAFVRISGLRGKGLAAKLWLVPRLITALWQAWRAIRRNRPDVVLGMGGYVAFPGGMMAALSGRPLVIHEQNAIAGLTNRLLARVANRVLASYPDSPRGAQLVGNPVRSAISGIPVPALRYGGRSGPLRLLVVGGSLGAAALNEAVPRALAMLDPARRPIVTHQAGATQLETLRANYAAVSVAVHPVAFIDDMSRAYAEADLVICRAGATTVAEVSAAGVAALFVPFPHAVDDHQTANARYLADHGAALLVPQRELTPERLAGLIGGLHREDLLAMAEKARSRGRADAARLVADQCMELAR